VSGCEAEGAGDQDALLLATRQRPEGPACQVRHADPLEARAATFRCGSRIGRIGLIRA
jgi:hypothetical protein